jgi:integrase
MAYLRRFPRSPYWYACFADAGGKWLQRSTKEIDRKRAQKIADQYEDAARQARLGFLTERQARKVIGEIYEISSREKLRSDSIGDFFTHWLGRVKVESSPKTFQRYEGVTARFLEWLGPRATLSVAHLSSVEIVQFRDYLARQHSPSSVNLSLAAIQAALSRAFDDRLVDVNEASRVPRLEDDPNRKQQRRAFTQEELRAILEVCDQEWRGMVLCGAYTGMRLGDVSLLRWENIDLAGRELHFKTEKTGRTQTIPIAEPLHRHLLEIASTDDPRAPLFPRAFAGRQREIPTGTLSNQFYRLMTRAGVVPPRSNKSKGKGRNAARTSNGLGFHCLRHTATTLLKRAGVSDVVAREIVGHETAAVSRTYSHIDASTLRAAIDRLPDITSDREI